MRRMVNASSLAVLVATVLSFAILGGDTQNSQSQQPPRHVDTSQFPTVEFGVIPADAKERARWQAKSKKYNRNHAPRIDESMDSIFQFVDWDVGLPAFPVARSATIVTGRITDARAYLSEDGTHIYSEFSIQVDEILKDDSLNPVTSGAPLFAEREGGRVRFPSGKIVTAQVVNQDMPRPGRRYVFFLTRTTLMGIDSEGRYLLTAYELREGHVFPLDKVSEKHPINQYRGKAEEEFLTELRAFIVNCPTITVAGPIDRGPIEFTATVSPENADLKLIFQWTVSRGEIKSGQGTSKITLDAERNGESIGASLEVLGLPANCPNKVSCWVSRF